MLSRHIKPHGHTQELIWQKRWEHFYIYVCKCYRTRVKRWWFTAVINTVRFHLNIFLCIDMHVYCSWLYGRYTVAYTFVCTQQRLYLRALIQQGLPFLSLAKLSPYWYRPSWLRVIEHWWDYVRFNWKLILLSRPRSKLFNKERKIVSLSVETQWTERRSFI